MLKLKNMNEWIIPNMAGVENSSEYAEDTRTHQQSLLKEWWIKNEINGKD